MDGVRARNRGVQREKRGLYISPLAPLPFFCFLLLNEGMLFPCIVLAALLHELGHVLAIYACGGRVQRVGIYPFGAEIVTGGRLLGYGQSLFVCLSGIGVNLSCALLLLLPRCPGVLQIFGGCSLALALFNLLPLKRLDGGEALKNLGCLLVGIDGAERLCRVFSLFGGLFFLLFTAGGILFARFNPLTLLLCLYLLWGVL